MADPIDPRKGEHGNPADAGSVDPDKQIQDLKETYETLQRILKENGGTYDPIQFQTAFSNLMDANLKLVEADIDRKIQDTTKRSKAKEWYKDKLGQAIRGTKAFKNGFTSFSEVFKDMLDNDTFKKLENSDPTTKEAIKNYKESTTRDMQAEMAKFLPKFLEEVRREFGEFELDDNFIENNSNWKEIISKKLSKANDLAERLAKEKKGEFAENQLKDLLEKQKKGLYDPTSEASQKANSGRSFKDVLKYLIILSIFGGSLGLFSFFLCLYADEHSGCQLVQAPKGQLPVSSKVVCFNDGQNISIFNPRGGNVEYSTDQCSCKAPKNTPPSTCNAPTCSSSEDVRPWICSPNANPKCSGSEGDDSYIIYWWGIMTPFGGLGNLADGVVNGIEDAGSHWLNTLLKFLIPVFIGIGILTILWIILKYYEHHEEVALNIKTKFGNVNYLGNLQKFSNYTYMGGCNSLPTKTYIPSRFLL